MSETARDMIYLRADAEGRIAVASIDYPDSIGPNAIQVEAPEGFSLETAENWRVTEDAETGAWALVYDPLPEPETEPNPVTQLQAENQLLRAQVQALSERGEFMEDVIAEMAGKVYGGA